MPAAIWTGLCRAGRRHLAPMQAVVYFSGCLGAVLCATAHQWLDVLHSVQCMMHMCITECTVMPQRPR